MILGYHHQYGAQPPLNKWILSIEIRKCPPTMFRTFRPYIRVVCVKFFDLGEPWKIDGLPQKKIGGWWEWCSPIGIYIEISR